jgi:hypothetical protein
MKVVYALPITRRTLMLAALQSRLAKSRTLAVADPIQAAIHVR